MATIQPKKRLFGAVMLSLCALIWGFAFVAQSNASEHLSAASFSGMRFIFSFIGLFVIYVVYEALNKKFHYHSIPWSKETLIGGILCGLALYLAMFCQQTGIETTTVSKASFITAMYIVIVPLVGIVARQKPSIYCLPAILIAVLGFYFMCINDSFKLTWGDAFVLACAMMYSMQILFISIYVKECDAIKLTLVQFASAAVIGIIAMAIDGFPSGVSIKSAIWEILYLGILSGTIGFTLQTVGQKCVQPATATLIMSVEAVVGLVGGVIFLSQYPTPREVLGCLLVLFAVILAQQETHRTFLRLSKNKYYLS